MQNANEIIQGTDEWHRIRLGKVTASNITNVMMARDKAGYQNYMAQLAVERLTGKPTTTFKSAAMAQGNDLEPQARANYELDNGVAVEEVGFVHHPDIAMSGCSPDGLVGNNGMVQFKCPEPKTHISYLLGTALPRIYSLQCQWELACAEREWTDFVSFNPDMPVSMRIFRKRIGRNEDTIAEISAAVKRFLAELETMTRNLKNKYPEV